MWHIELIGLFLFKVLLDIITFFYVIPKYQYEPFLQFGQIDYLRLWLSYVVLFVVWIAIRPVLTKRYPISRLILIVQVVVIVIPFLTLFAQEERRWNEVIYICLPIVLIALFVRISPKIKLPECDKSAYLIISIVFACIVVYVLLGLIVTGGLSRLNFNFYHVYEVRDLLKNNPFPLSGYLISWVAHVINIAFLISGVIRRNWLIIAFAFVIQILIFGMTNFKSFLILPFFVLGFLFLLKRMNFVLSVVFGVNLLILLLICLHFTGEDMGLGLFSRIFIVPAAIHSLYFDYFSSHAPAMMAGTKWASLFGAQYDENIIFIVAKEYWGKEFSPNVGWLGDAFANFGITGAFVITVLFALFLKICDSVANSIQTIGIAESLLFGAAIAFCSSAFSTVLLTHGAGLAVIALWWLVKANKKV